MGFRYVTPRTVHISNANGADTYASTGSPDLDLFFQAGALRTAMEIPHVEAKALSMFRAALDHNAPRAAKLAYWLRSVREGAGERLSGFVMIRELCRVHPEFATVENMKALGEYGYWKDVVRLAADPTTHNAVANAALVALADAIHKGDRLACKWAPRAGTAYGSIVPGLRRELGMTNKEYRKHLNLFSETVEQALCAQAFTEIEYPKVPSVAMRRYRKAFKRRDTERFDAFLGSKTQKANADALYPFQVYDLSKGSADDKALADKQWDALPPLSETTTERIFPMIDVSGSMRQQANGIEAMSVAISTGMYVSEHLPGPFNRMFMTFSEKPELVQLSDDESFSVRAHKVSRANWGMSTDLQAAFTTLLETAVTLKVDPSDMPTMFLVISDMQFDQSIPFGGNPYGERATFLENLRTYYEAAGYQMPKLVFWNVVSYPGAPAQSNTANVALVSGFSPQILNATLRAGEFDPVSVMLEAIEPIQIDVSMLP